LSLLRAAIRADHVDKAFLHCSVQYMRPHYFQVKVMIAPEIETKLTEAQARSAMLSNVASHCCYGKAAAKNMSIKKMEYLPAYHYELQTFTEKRETSWTYAAIRTGYESMLGSSLGSGVPPLPWEIFEEPAQAFKDEVRLVQVNIFPGLGLGWPLLSVKSRHRVFAAAAAFSSLLF
jgi:hypothetical protein